MPRHPPAECPVCGKAVPPRARACPHCGADERSGWDEESAYLDGVDLPEDDASGDEGIRPRSTAPTGLRWRWWITAVLLLAVLVAAALVGHP
ncbi:MAG: zinc-ribbon domain-containing protein [Verrucomicrobia bacterium]|nr:zinc-ribbon domain-containing protein [Verrucomicrobiota bacterium]